MPQIFPKALNPIAKMVVLGLPLLAGGAGISGAAFYRSSYATGVNDVRPQPVAFSHAHHVGQLGIDCRYCHTSVEKSSSANIPPTKTCINCHQQIWIGADMLGEVRASFASDQPIVWNRVHNLPHYAYFNHSIHLAKGVGCESCHGRVDQMNLMAQSSTLLMEWCIACHRVPEKHLRPNAPEIITKMGWTADMAGPNPESANCKLADQTLDRLKHDKVPDEVLAKLAGLKDKELQRSKFEGEVAKLLTESEKDKYLKPIMSQSGTAYTQLELGLKLKDEYKVRDAVTLTGCSRCHR